MLEYKGKYTTAKVMIDHVDDTTAAQIVSMTNDPSFTQPIVIMPDVHAGKGSVIGFTMGLGDRIIPFIVGVDISCGLISARINLSLVENIKDITKFDQVVRQSIPMGMKVRKKPALNMERAFPYGKITEYAREFIMAYNKKFGTAYSFVKYSYEHFKELCERVDVDQWYAQCSLGTLGGGK